MFRNQTFSKWRLFCYYVTKTDHPCESAAVRRNSIHFIGWRFTSLHAVSEYFTISGVFKWRHTGIYSGQSVVWMTSCFTVGMKRFYLSCRLLLPKGKWPTVSTQEVVQDTRGKITCLSLKRHTKYLWLCWNHGCNCFVFSSCLMSSPLWTPACLYFMKAGHLV